VPGTWAFQKYGRGVKVIDTLQYRLDWLRESHVRLKAARAAALERPLPSAFVTFKCARGSGSGLVLGPGPGFGPGFGLGLGFGPGF
jgi:hypothetical protein